MRRSVKVILGCLALLAVSTGFITLKSEDVSASSPATIQYTYDSLGRLMTATGPANAQSYDYDSAGNRTQAGTQ